MKLIYVVVFICLLTPVYADFQIDNPTIPHLNSVNQATSSCGGGNCNGSFNQTLADTLYWKLDSSNDHLLSAGWNMGDNYLWFNSTEEDFGSKILFGHATGGYYKADIYSGTSTLFIHGNENQGITLDPSSGDGSTGTLTGGIDIHSGYANNGANGSDVKIWTAPVSLTSTIPSNILIYQGNVPKESTVGEINVTSAKDLNLKSAYGDVYLGYDYDDGSGNLTFYGFEVDSGTGKTKFRNYQDVNISSGTVHIEAPFGAFYNDSEICTEGNNLCPNKTYADTLYWKTSGTSTLTDETTINFNGNDAIFSLGIFGSSFKLKNNAFYTDLIPASANASITFPALTCTLGNVNCGGTSATSFNARQPILAGITSAGAFQSVTASATANQLLKNGGTGVNPSWTTATYPNTCTASNLMVCTATNTFSSDSTVTWTSTASPEVFNINGRKPQYKLTDSDIGHDDYNIYNNDGILSIGNTVDLIDFISVKGSGGITLNAGSDHTIDISDRDNFVLATSTGTKIGTATTQKLGFWNVAPIVQPVSTTAIDTVLTNTGLRASGGISNFATQVNATAGLQTTNLIVTGNFSATRAYGMFSSTETQTAVAPNTAYPVTFNYTEDAWLITKASDNSNFTFSDSGDYLIELSAIVDVDTPNKVVEIWVQKNAVNIPRSNTRVKISAATTESLIVVPFIIDVNTTDVFRVMWASDDAGSRILYTTNTSYSPESPSIIMTLSKISEITP